jgi:transposase
VEVDWSGPTMQLADPVTGKARTVYLFVACLPLSRYAFVDPALDEYSLLSVHVWCRSGPEAVPQFALVSVSVGVVKHHVKSSLQRVRATWWKECR